MLHEAKPFIECATYLKANGAKNVIIMVTHAIFYGDTIQLIVKSCIDHVITSNSVNFQDHLKDASKVLFILRVQPAKNCVTPYTNIYLDSSC